MFVVLLDYLMYLLDFFQRSLKTTMRIPIHILDEQIYGFF